MQSRKVKKACAVVLAGVIAATTAFAGMPGEGHAAKKTSLKTKKISVTVGKTKKISVQGKKAKHKYTFTSKNKKIAKVSSKGVVIGVASGTTQIVVKDAYKQNKKKKVKKVGTVKVTVKKQNKVAAASATPAGTTQAAPTGTPAASAQATQAPAASADPTVEPTPTPEEIANLWPDESFEPGNTAEPDTPTGYARKINGVTYGEITEITYHSETTTKDRKANVLLPPNYDEQQKYPVLYLLHGLDGDHNEWKNGGRPDYVIGNLLAEGMAKEMIVVMPNVRARANDAGGPSDNHTIAHFQAFDNFINDLKNDLMPYIKDHYSIAEGRENTAIAGLSMGGRESLYIGISMPETFGYVGAFSPAPGVLPYATEGGLFQTENFKLPDEYNGKNFVMICTADNDTVVYDNPVQYAKTLEQNGTKSYFFMREGGGHGWDVWRSGLYNFAKRIFTKI